MKVKKDIRLRAAVGKQNAARVKLDLPKIEIKIRTCTTCHALFESVGNRRCSDCKRLESISALNGREII